MKTILTKIKHKSVLFENIQGFVSTRHYILSYLISNDKEYQEQLKVFNDIKKNNQLSENFMTNFFTFISDRILFRIVNEENILDKNDEQFVKEEEVNKYNFLRKRMLSYYLSGKYSKDININISKLRKYFPNKKELALFIFDFLVNKNINQITSIFPNYNLIDKNDINKFLSYYEKNKNKFEYNEKINIISYEEIEPIYKKMNRKVFLSVAFIGNKNSGKSTTIGHLLYNTGFIEQGLYVEATASSNSLGVPSYKYSWLMDKLTEERTNRKSVMYHLNKLETKKYEFNLIDLPGDIHLRKNIMKGLSLADAVVIVVSAENESKENDHLKDYLIVTYTIGIRQLIIAINKMDYSNYSEEKFMKIKKNMNNLCEVIGFNPDNIQFIAYSGYSGLNLVNQYEDQDISHTNKMAWYKGKTLLESLDDIKPIKRNFNDPLKISIFNAFEIQGIGTIIRGKILSGHFERNTELYTIINQKEAIITTKALAIEIHHRQVDEAIAGDIVSILEKKQCAKNFKNRWLVFNYNDKIIQNFKIVDNLRVKILMINKKVTLRIGSDLNLFCYTASVPVRIVKIEYIIDEANKILEKNPKEIKNGGFAILIIKIIKKYIPFRAGEKEYHGLKHRHDNKNVLYCEKYKYNPQLGSFALFNNDLFAVGFIKDINVL